MNQLIRAELRKLRTVRSTAAIGGLGIGIALLLGFANAAIAGEPGAPVLGSAGFVEDVVGVSTIPVGLALLAGILLAAGEHQHGTITTTFLATPRRGRVLAAKAAAGAVAGSVLAAAMVVASAWAAAVVVLTDGASVDAFHAEIVIALAGLLVGSALLGAGGALLGLLVRSQVAAVTAIGAWVVVAEGILDVVTGGRLRAWLPGGAAAALAGNGDRPLWEAAALICGWVGVVAAITVPVVLRRDVTS